MKMFKHNKKINGFTFVELLVSLIVSAIIFAAIASLVFAIGAANDSSDQAGANQARIRFTMVRLDELIKYAKLVTLSGSDDLAIWVADNDEDNQIDIDEIAFIEAGPGRDQIVLLEYQPSSFVMVGGFPLAMLKDGSAKNSLVMSGNIKRTEIMPQCSNVTFIPNDINEQDRFVCISFNITESEQTRYYQISSIISCKADNIIDEFTIDPTDDD